MKKFLTLFYIVFLLFLTNATSFAITDKTRIAENVSMVEKLVVKKMVNDIENLSNKQNIEKIKEYYDTDFKSVDNYTYDEYFETLQETFKTYSNIKYKMNIEKICKKDDVLVVTIKDTVSGILKTEGFSFKYGILDGNSKYDLYLKQDDKKNWKITRDIVEEENTSLTYGEANLVKMELITPKTIKNGEEYTIGLKVYPWTKSFVIASINNDSIEKPAKKPEEVFRKLPQDGFLERIVPANKNGKNEYALASVGFTRASLGKDSLSINFKMSGIAFLLKRINMENIKEVGAI